MESMGKKIMCGNGEMKKGARKLYQRLSHQQTQYLERYFNKCPHPNDKQRAELSNQLDLSLQQIKFWFQNRRTMIKTRETRTHISILRQVNQMLRDDVEQMISNINHYQQENQMLEHGIENATDIAYADLGRSIQGSGSQ